MKRLSIHTFWVLLTFAFVLVTTAEAQEQKVGYVDTDYILSRIPEYQGVQQQLRQRAQEWRNQLNAMQQEIDRLKEDFEEKEILYTEELRKQKQQEIQNKVQQREQYLESKFGPEGEYFQTQQQLLEPIQRRIFDAITVVAEREGFDFVFDRAQDSTLLFSRNEWNLNNDVLIELGISPDQNSN